MKKFIFRNSISLLLALTLMLSAAPYSAIFATADEASVPACSCDNSDILESHSDGCARKEYCKKLSDENSAEELYAMWSSLPEDVTVFVLTYLGWSDQTKKAELEKLLEGQSSGGTKYETVIENANISITLNGNLPEDITLTASSIAVDEYSERLSEYIDSSKLLFAFDLTLLNTDNSKWQPNDGESVTVSLNAQSVGLVNGNEFYVYHIKNDNTTEILGPFYVVNETVTFITESFSSFIIANGDTTLGAGAEDDFVTMNPNSSSYGSARTYYIMPGTSITFYSVNSTRITWQPDNKQNALNIKKVTQEKYTITVPKNATIGSKTIFTANGCTVTIIVSTKETVVDHALKDDINNMYGLYFSCLTDPNNGIPVEPGVNTRTFKYIRSDYGVFVKDAGQSNCFSRYKVPGDFIKSTVVEDLVTTADGSCTLGIVDYTGEKIKAHLQDVDFEKALSAIAETGEVYSTDGTRITESNYKNYDLIPYVLKLQTVSGWTWNLDCYIVHKEFHTLSYDYNLPSDRYINMEKYPLPEPFTSYKDNNGKWTTTTVGSDLFVVDSKLYYLYNIDNIEYPYVFKGWATSSDGDVVYKPGAQILVNKNIVLYAVWKEATTSLTIQKSGTHPADTNQTFIFNICGIDKTSTATINITITVHGNNSTTITNLPVGKYAITEISGWSWRYELNTITINSGTGTLKFNSSNKSADVYLEDRNGVTILVTNNRTESKWLDGDNYSQNVFNGAKTVITPKVTIN